MARGFAAAMIAALLASASMGTPAVATDDADVSCPCAVDGLPEYLADAAKMWARNTLAGANLKCDMSNWRCFVSNTNVDSATGKCFVSPGKHKFAKPADLKYRVENGRSVKIESRVFKPPKLNDPKKKLFTGNDAESRFEKARAETEAFNSNRTPAEKAACRSGVRPTAQSRCSTFETWS